MNDEELKSMWSNQAIPVQTISLEQIREQADALRRSHIREYWMGQVSCAAVIVIFAAFAIFVNDGRMRLGCALTALGSVIVLYRMRQLASIRALPAADIAAPYVDFMKAELGRQRDALRGVVLWFIAPNVPGLVALVWSMSHDNGIAFPWQIPMMFVIPFLVAIWMHFAKARRLQRKIDAL
jgi:hypothetical protein